MLVVAAFLFAGAVANDGGGKKKTVKKVAVKKWVVGKRILAKLPESEAL